MTKEHNEHLIGILDRFNDQAIKKYTKGNEQHGGKLWLKKDLIDKSIEEVIDLLFYLFTLKDQINNNTLYSVTEEDKD